MFCLRVEYGRVDSESRRWANWEMVESRWISAQVRGSSLLVHGEVVIIVIGFMSVDSETYLV